MQSENKSPFSVVSCGLFLTAVTALQLEHLHFFQGQINPLDEPYYRVLLFLAPPLFYFFSRFLLFRDYRLNKRSALHLIPIAITPFTNREIAVPIAFIVGSGYCLWLSYVIYRVREQRNRFAVEFFFFGFFSLLAIAVLIVGFSATYINDAYFYYFYANGLSFAFCLVTGALIIYPNLLSELTEVVQLGYSKSTLTNIDVDASLKQLEQFMQQDLLFQNETLNLAKLAECMELTSHQLSELINSNFDVSFSQYLRQVRVEYAKKLLIEQPNASILAISIETGFKSQSNFYAAFKEIVCMSPGAYRKCQTIT